MVPPGSSFARCGVNNYTQVRLQKYHSRVPETKIEPKKRIFARWVATSGFDLIHRTLDDFSSSSILFRNLIKSTRDLRRSREGFVSLLSLEG